ncbi:MAG TPA: hypothetical protein VJ914_16100 [Pseudonocardiaceae bacterium]|nr:hypothetical protein [Pseudonocardiaceae bacterium]
MSFGDWFGQAVDGAAISLPLPVYGFVKDVTEAVSRECGMSERGAKATGMIVGAAASLTTSAVVGTP